MRMGLVVRFILSLLLASFVVPLPAMAQVSAGFRITLAPPPLPIYAQPAIPADGYIWIPGYWAWGPSGYYWVPGTWTQPLQPGLLWTPGYWEWVGDRYLWHAGYWAPNVGYYGGVNYGFGYDGNGYDGGQWDGGYFVYNAAVNNLGRVPIAHVFRREVRSTVPAPAARVSFNGGVGGMGTRPGPAHEAATHEAHAPPTPAQTQHEQAASARAPQRVAVNHGAPPVAGTARPATFAGPGITAARGAPRPAVTPAAAHPPAAAAPAARPAAPAPRGQPGHEQR